MFNDNGKTALYYKNVLPTTGHVFRELLGNYNICLSSVILRKACLNNLCEMFDNRFNHVEEADLFTRIAYQWQLDCVNESLVRNRIHKNSSTFLRPELAPKETDLMLQKFIILYPEILRAYNNEIAQIRYYIQYGYALLDWKAGNNARVRERLRPYFSVNHKAKLQFLFSYFPFSLYDVMLRYYRNYVKRIPLA
jgi:hypothetical protein